MIKPSCLVSREPALTARGYFLPCCQVDRRCEEFEERGFLDPSLNIENVDDIEFDVFNSEVWVKFFHDAQHNQDSMPKICHYHCGPKKTTGKDFRLIEVFNEE